MIQLHGGPHDGLDVTELCGSEIHFFVIDKRMKGQESFLSYYFRPTEHECLGLTFQKQIPSGAVGTVVVFG